MASSKKIDAEIVKLYYSNGSPTTVIRETAKQHPEKKVLSKMKIKRLVDKFEKKTGSVTDGRHWNPGRPKRSAENIASIEDVISETPQRSFRKIFEDVTNTFSHSSVHRILRYDLNLKPYTLSIMQHLKNDIERRLHFTHWVKTNPAFVDLLWFSDESYFFLNSAINKKICRHWGPEKPEYHLEKSLHSENVTVWAALSKDWIIWPFFFEDQDGHAETINSERYPCILNKKFVPALRTRGFSVNHIWFQQDGATPHTSSAVLDWIKETFKDRVDSLKTQYAWPPHSPDLSPLDFYLWGFLKDRAYKPSPTTLKELDANIRRETEASKMKLAKPWLTISKHVATSSSHKRDVTWDTYCKDIPVCFSIMC